MNTIKPLALVLASLAVAASAQAQPPADGAADDSTEGTRTRFYDFNELELTGKAAKPNVLYTDARQRAQFERMFKLRRSFMPELRRSADGASSPEGGGK